MDELFQRIESRFGFKLPKSFKEAWLSGWCSQPSSTCLYMPDMEWLPLPEIADYAFESYQLPGFVPFATTGGGDLWCWQIDSDGPDGPRVVECPHDCYDGSVYAADFRGALFRHLVDSACQMFLAEDQLREQLNRIGQCFQTISTTLRSAEFALLESLLATPIMSEVLPAVRPTRWYFVVPPRSVQRGSISESFPSETVRWMRPD